LLEGPPMRESRMNGAPNIIPDKYPSKEGLVRISCGGCVIACLRDTTVAVARAPHAKKTRFVRDEFHICGLVFRHRKNFVRKQRRLGFVSAEMTAGLSTH
jgi:hypothetical protein